MYFRCVAVKAMDDPFLLGLVLFEKSEDIGSGFYMMNNKRLLVLFGKKDMLFEELQLKVKGIFVDSIKTCFSYSDNFVFLKKRFQK